ncbi:MAG: PAS domain S-box protein [Trueperaceae bacterium]|nr:PAS domain S-box protein [Trueperaceae bacterium]
MSSPASGAAVDIGPLFHANPQPLLLVDLATWRILEVNDAGLLLYGFPRETLRQMRLAELWMPGAAPADLPERLDAPVDPDRIEQHRTRTDEPVWVSVAAHRVAVGDRDVALVSVQDLTQRVRAEEAARRSERFYRAIIENAFDGVSLIGADLKVREVGEMAARTLGFRAPELEARDRRDLIHPNDRRVFADAVDRLRGRPGERESVTYRTRDAKGRWHWLEGTVTNLIEDPAIGAYVLNYHDVTARVRASEEVAHLNAQLERRLQHLQALRRIDMAITNAIDVGLALDIFLEQVQADLQVEAAGVLLYDPHAQTLEPAAARGFETPLAKGRVRLGEGLAGHAALEQRTVHVPDLRSDERDGAVVDVADQAGYVAYWAVPMLTKGQLQGVIELYARRPLVPDAEWFEFLETFADQGAIAVESAQLFRSLERSNVDLQLAYDRTIEGWAYALDLKDEETAGHSKRVTALTVRMAQRLGMDAKELVHVQRGALLHDIGKMGVPDSILLKRGSLTDAEFAEMQRHTVYAYELLSPIDFLRPALEIPYAHHEKWDGSGYPRGLRGEQIPLAARIFAIVDVYDALTSDRPYRAAWDRETTLAYIQEQAGSHFDPRLVEAFMAMVRADA